LFSFDFLFFFDRLIGFDTCFFCQTFLISFVFLFFDESFVLILISFVKRTF
jgi:hypothetical protein